MPQSQLSPSVDSNLKRDNDKDSGPDSPLARSQGPARLGSFFESRSIVGIALLSNLGGFLAGYDQGIISHVITMESFGAAFPNLYMNAVLTGWCVGTLLLAATVGSWLTGSICDKIGRTGVVKFNVIVFLLGTSLQTGAASSTYLFVGRAFSGWAVGALTHTIPLYIAEISTAKTRGSLVSLQQLAITVGLVAGYWIANSTSHIGGTRCAPGVPYTGPLLGGKHTFDPYNDVPNGGCTGQTQASWRVPLGLQLFPALCLGVGMLFMPHSPRWLVAQDREKEALQTLSRLRQKPADDHSVRFEFLEIMADVQYTREATDAAYPNASPFKLWVRKKIVFFTTRKMRKRMVVGCLSLAFQQNMFAIVYFAPMIFGQLGLSQNTTSLLVGLYGIVNILATLPAIILIDRVGRRPLLISGAAGCFISLIIMGTLVTLYGSDWKAHGVAARTVITFMFIYNINYSYSWGPVGWVIPAEIYPLHLRSIGLGYTTSAMWFGIFMAASSLPNFLKKSGGVAYYITSVFCVIGFILAKFLFPETKGWTLEETDAAFGSKVTDSEREHKECICRDLGLPVNAPLTA